MACPGSRSCSGSRTGACSHYGTTGALRPGWPDTLVAAATGAALVRSAPGPSPTSAVILPISGHRFAYAPNGKPLPRYPKSGLSDAAASLCEFGPGLGDRLVT